MIPVNITETINIIQILLTPVLMISACGLLLLTMQNRYGRLNDRLRELSRERMDISEESNPSKSKYRTAIDRQIPDLLKRNKILRDALVSTFSSVLCFILVIFFIALVIFNMTRLSPLFPLLVFFVGQFFLLLGIICMVREAFISHRAVTYETREILNLQNPQ